MSKSTERGSFGISQRPNLRPRVLPTGVPVQHERIKDFTDLIGPKHPTHPYNRNHDKELGIT